ncbi:MAG: GAF domain-containing protein [Candidatus Riflebacteria bacterium]|nr:GAF domain-containing protein [Candidatus Riflebacteria bacterium]
MKGHLRLGKRKYPLDKPVITIGRNPEADIPIDGPEVSGHHALVIRADDHFLIYDFKSSNGVRIDGKRILVEARLQTGQIVDIGGFKLEFVQTVSRADRLQTPGATAVKAADPARQASAGAAPPVDPGAQEDQAAVSTWSLRRRPSGEELLKRTIEKDVYTLIKERPGEEDLVSKLLILYKVSSIVSSIVDTDTLLHEIVDLTLEVMSADRGFVMLVNPDGKLETRVYRLKASGEGTLDQDDDPGGLSFSHSIAESCFETGEAIFTNDAMADKRFPGAKSIQIYNIRCAMCVPLSFRERRRGVLYTDNRRTSDSFTPSDFLLLKAFAEQAAIAIENSLLLAELKASLEKIQGQQEMLVQAEKMSAMGHLAAGLAHEIRNPLTAMAGYVEIYFRLFKPDAPFYAQMRVVEKAVSHMHHIVDGLLGFARKGPLQLEPGSINQVIEETLQLGRPALVGHRNVRIATDLDPAAPPVTMDQRQLQQVFLNLIMNAVQAMPDGGTLTVRSRSELPDGAPPGGAATHIVVTVEDTGSGIPAANQAQIFQPFFTSGKKGGTGLGLTISKSIVENHGGRIVFRSVEGQGTTFSVVLPAGKASGSTTP